MGFSVIYLIILCAALWTFKVILQKCRELGSIWPSLSVCPGRSILWFHPLRTAAIVTASFCPPKGHIGHFFSDFSLYARYKSTCLSSMTFWNASPIFWLSDADAIKTVQTSRGFIRDVESYEPLNVYGPNIISAEGSDWKRHRSVASRAFNEKNTALVWHETCRVVDEWFSEIDHQLNGQTQVVIDLRDDLAKVTLLLILRAAFGRQVSWKDDSNVDSPPGHKRTFKNAICSTVKHMLTKALIPSWIYRLSTVIHLPFASTYHTETTESFEALRMHLLDIINAAQDRVTKGNTTDAALLHNLVEANKAQEGSKRYLSDNELLSDIFAFLLAGHETSAHTLCFAISLLALYPEVQRRAYEEACQFWSDTMPQLDCPVPSKYSIARLEYISAIYHETLRLFPSITRIAKQIAVDTTLTARRFGMTLDGRVLDTEDYDVPVRAGGLAVIDILGLHTNPIHWGHDAASFRPERFIDTDTYKWPRDAFQAFSGGMRSCIGQRFSLTESVCILARVVRRYEICLPEELKIRSPEEQKEMLLKWKPWVTITPLHAKVVLRVRT